MMRRYFILVACSMLLASASYTQGNKSTTSYEIAPKPYKLVSSGSNVSVKSSAAIKSILVWTAEGKRIVEEKNVNATTYNFRLTSNARYFFVRIQMGDGKTFSEKIAARTR